VVLANPPYSINEWDREAFANDKYGRNFLGVPPQGRADYAFIQHIIKSLKKNSGRCAILLPHGVLSRSAEQDIRENLLKSDLVECVIGLGEGLFYNSPMDACIIICRTKKPTERRGHVLFINAVNEVTKKRAERYLDDVHIQKIADVYFNYANIVNFAKVVPLKIIAENKFSLELSFYVRETIIEKQKKCLSLNEVLDEWVNNSTSLRSAFLELKTELENNGDV